MSRDIETNWKLSVTKNKSPHSEPRFSYILFQFLNQTPKVTERVAYCVMVGTIFDANQQNTTRLENNVYYRDVITIAKLKTWAPCEGNIAILRHFGSPNSSNKIL